MSFENFAGNDHIKTQLKRFITTGQILNSYVFSGETGIGKKTLSDVFVKEVFCEAPSDGGACGTCSACLQIQSDNHPDIIYLTKQKDKKTYGIDEIREQIIKQAYIKPFIASKKIFVIKEGDDLTTEAQNGLLKVLEEPPEYVTFIILVSEKSRLLDTVLSRSCVINLHPAPLGEVNAFLKKSYPSLNDNDVDFYSKFSQGIIGKAIKIIENEDYRALFYDTAKHLSSVIKTKDTFVEAHKFLIDNKDSIQQITEFMLIFFRDCIFSCEGLRKNLICPQNLNNIPCDTGSKKKYILCMDSVIDFKNKMKFNASFSFSCLELLTDIQKNCNTL